MTVIVEKLHQRTKRLLNKKGQGLVEFALILAFCLGIGFVARNAGLLDAFTASLNQGVFAFLNIDVDESTASGNGSSNSGTNTGTSTGTETGTGGTGTGGSGGGTSTGNTGVAGVGTSGHDWGAEDPTKYYKQAYNGGGHSFTQVDSQADRLAADQKSLENIAKFFLGKTQNDIIGLLNGKTADMAVNEQEVLLGHFVPYEYYNGTKTGKGMRFNADGVLNKEEAQNIFAWMQGIYDTVSDGAKDEYGAVINDAYDHDRLYLVSDYIVSQKWADNAGSFQGNGIRIQLEYDYSGSYIYPESYTTNGAVQVVGIQLCIDPRSQKNTEVDNDQFNSPSFNTQNSKGLEVHIRLLGKDENGKDKYSIAYKDTGVTSTGTKNGMTRWYGDDLMNNPTNWKKVCIASKEPQDISNGGIFDFEKGDIIQYGSNHYIAMKEKKNLTIKKGLQQKELEYKNSYQNGTLETQIFVKITGKNVDDVGSYIIENAKISFDEAKGCYPKKPITWRGWPVIVASGEVYLYVGDVQPTVYTHIDEENFIKLRDKNSEWSN